MFKVLNRPVLADDKSKIAIIVPYRDNKLQNRAKQKKEFIKLMKDFIKKSKKRIKIFIIKQSNDGRKFNRGKLLNIGFHIARKKKYNIFIFHDIDLIPSKELFNYYESYPISPLHLAETNKKYPFQNYFGGVVSFNDKDFIKINGFPNDYWGWGGEDDELLRRIRDYNLESGLDNKKLSIYRPSKSEGRIRELFHKDTKDIKEMKNQEKWELKKKHKSTWKRNGLSNLEYSVLNIIKKKYFQVIKVKL